MACLVNSSAFAFSSSSFSYPITPTTLPIKNMPSKQDALRFPPVWKHRVTTRQNFSSDKLSPIKSMQVHEALPEGLKPELMPKHVAIILDGNRRWAKENGLSVELGHLSGGRVIKNIAFLCNKWGVNVLSIFTFSTENWTRPKAATLFVGLVLVDNGLIFFSLKPELMPNHIGIISDGNRRWANEKGFKSQLGHRNGARVMKEIVFLCCKWGIKVVSFFAFSTENLARPKEQVDALMSLFEDAIQTDMEEFKGYNVQISFIGDKSKLPKSLQELMATVEDSTRGNMGLHLMIAINYSGRYDIMQASRSIASKVKEGFLRVEDINETLFEKELKTNCAQFPNPDLLIRTSGEQRISNFYLWQLAYTEVFFSVKKFPDFEEEDFIEALISFQKRERRYGGNKY